MRWWWVPEMTSSHACLGSINGENLIWRNGTVGESEGFSHSGAVVLATAEQRYKVGKGLSWPWGWGSGRCVDVRCSLGTHLVVQSRSGLAAKAGLPESQVSSNKSRGLDVVRNLVCFLALVLPLAGWLGWTRLLTYLSLDFSIYHMGSVLPVQLSLLWMAIVRLWKWRTYGASPKPHKCELQLFFIICW